MSRVRQQVVVRRAGVRLAPGGVSYLWAASDPELSGKCHLAFNRRSVVSCVDVLGIEPGTASSLVDGACCWRNWRASVFWLALMTLPSARTVAAVAGQGKRMPVKCLKYERKLGRQIRAVTSRMIAEKKP